MFPEDDEMDEREELNGIDREMANLTRARHDVMKRIKQKQLDPLVARALQLAHDAGHAIGANEALAKRIAFLEKRLEVRDKLLEEWGDYPQVKQRMEVAEEKLTKRRKRK